MKLKINELKKFKTASGFIKPNNTMPVLSYLKFKDGFITKSNMEFFVKMEADFEGEMLIDETQLFSMVNYLNADEIEATTDENSVILISGKKISKGPTEDIKSFPETASVSKKPVEINSDVMNSISIASGFTFEDPNTPFTGAVFIGNGIVAACNNVIAYTMPHKKIPTLIIEKKVCDVICKLDGPVMFSENDTYTFFENGPFTFGFVKKDIPFVNFEPFSKVPGGDRIKVNKDQLMAFCQTCIERCAGRPIVASITSNKLLMNESGYENSFEDELNYKIPDFNFVPQELFRLLKCLPGDLEFIKSENKFFVTGSGGFVSLIMEFKNINK